MKVNPYFIPEPKITPEGLRILKYITNKWTNSLKEVLEDNIGGYVYHLFIEKKFLAWPQFKIHNGKDWQRHSLMNVLNFCAEQDNVKS